MALSKRHSEIGKAQAGEAAGLNDEFVEIPTDAEALTAGDLATALTRLS